MTRDNIIRGALWITAVANAGAAVVIAFPSSTLGRLAGLPDLVPVIYRALLAFMVALFGGAYAWLAIQPRIDHPLVALSAAGKAGVVVIVLACWLGGQATARSAILFSGDLVFAAIFLWWLATETGHAASAP